MLHLRSDLPCEDALLDHVAVEVLLQATNLLDERLDSSGFFLLQGNKLDDVNERVEILHERADAAWGKYKRKRRV